MHDRSLTITSILIATLISNPAGVEAGTAEVPLAEAGTLDRLVLLEEMDVVSAMPLTDFLSFKAERVDRAGLAIYDWRSDGCTSPIPAFQAAVRARSDHF